MSESRVSAVFVQPGERVLFSGSRLIGIDPEGCKVTLEYEIKSHIGETWKRSIDLEPAPTHRTLSITGAGKKPRALDISYGGQCQDTIKKDLLSYRRLFMPIDDVQEILSIWDRWHLNDLNAGTRTQYELLTLIESKVERETWDRLCSAAGGWFTYACMLLKKFELLEDRGYKYGSEWLVEHLPEAIQRRVVELFTTKEA